jgi:hypothetical protein
MDRVFFHLDFKDVNSVCGSHLAQDGLYDIAEGDQKLLSLLADQDKVSQDKVSQDKVSEVRN